MGAKRIIWHVGFGRLLRRRGPRSFEVRDEVPLSDEPSRMDFLLLRKMPGAPEGDPPRTLLRLWPLLPLVTVLEYKSPRRPYRAGNLDRLWSYVHAYHADDLTRSDERAHLAAVLAVPHRTPSLDADVQAMGLAWHDLGAGYWQLIGGLFALHVVEINVVAAAEDDDLLHSLGNGQLLTLETRRFWMELVGSQEAGTSMQDLEGYDELMDEVLAGMSSKRRLAGLPPEERLADLDHDHQALALPLDVLRLMPETYFRSLSSEVAAELRRRLTPGEAAHPRDVR